jgi:hypothetical protein
VEMSPPCQGRSIARSLAEWSEEQHPHHDLWFLQPHEQQNASKNEFIRAEAITEAHQCLVSASSPNMGGYYNLIRNDSPKYGRIQAFPMD